MTHEEQLQADKLETETQAWLKTFYAEHTARMEKNRRIAELLGWTQLTLDLFIEEGGGLHTQQYCGNAPDGIWGGFIPDYTADLNAFAAALEGRDVLVTLRPDQPLTVTITDTAYTSLTASRNPRYVASATDDVYQGGKPTLQQLAGAALLEYLEAHATKGGGS